MPSTRIRFGGLELMASARAEALSFGASVSNNVWKGTFRVLRRVLGGALNGTAESPQQKADILPPDVSPERKAILEQVAQVDWYHSIDLGHSVVTPGHFDHNPYLASYRLPERLDGLRVLDVGSWDGYWAFEFERRGAREVVAIDVDSVNDIDLPPRARAKLTREELARGISRRGFELAHKTLGSRVRREVLSVYDLSPERLGKFDVVHCGDILVHLMNPFKALQNVCRVARGYALISECVFPELTWSGSVVLEYKGGLDDCHWWNFSSEGLAQMIRDAGFDQIDLLNTFRYSTRGLRASTQHAVFRASRPMAGLD